MLKEMQLLVMSNEIQVVHRCTSQVLSMIPLFG